VYKRQLVYWVYQNERQVSLPLLPGIDAKDTLQVVRCVEVEANKPQFKPVNTPAEFDIVLMARNKAPHHVGLYLHGDMLVHAQDGAGTTASTLAYIKSLGFNHLSYYRWSL